MARRTSSTLLIVLVVTAAAILSSCRQSLGPPLAEWRVKADEICKQVQDDADKTRPVLFEQSLAQTLKKSADYSRAEAQQLRGLDKPSEEREKVRDYLATLDDRNRELDLLASQAEHPAPDFKPPSLDTLGTQTQKASEQADSLGLKSCRAGIDVSVGGSTTTSTTAPPVADPNAPTTPVPNPTDLDNETQDQLG